MCVPLFDMIRRWVFEGVLEDPACEFFVVPCSSSDTSSSSKGLPAASAAAASGSRDLWRDAYRLEPACVPPFINAELAETILRAGKSINFLRDACGDAQWVQEWAPAAAGTAAALGYGQVSLTADYSSWCFHTI
jgi:gamma-tubulin complex component 3